MMAGELPVSGHLIKRKTLSRSSDDMIFVLTVNYTWHRKERGEAEGKEVD
jgi:Flp pilus assembly secretin CpaC